MSFIPFGIYSAAGAGGGGPAGPSSYELIESSILLSNTASITFSSIPQDYKHLQLRFVARSTASNGTLIVRFNNDTGANYTLHRLTGNGTSVTSGGFIGLNKAVYAAIPGTADSTGSFGIGIVDILDYNSNVKNKTVKTLTGKILQSIELSSDLWINTGAITSVEITDENLIYLAGSRFSLYGIKG